VCSDIEASVRPYFDAAASDARIPAVCLSRLDILARASTTVHTAIAESRSEIVRRWDSWADRKDEEGTRS
jgi:hypothetical protein